LFSRTSLRKRSFSDGYGPTVSVGVTAQAALVEVVVVEFDEVVVVGLVGESPQPKAIAALAAPMTAIASRRPIFLLLIVAPRNFRFVLSYST
jgi:hypothetical protein